MAMKPGMTGQRIIKLKFPAEKCEFLPGELQSTLSRRRNARSTLLSSL